MCGGNDGGVSVVEEKRGNEVVVRGLLVYGIVGCISGGCFYGFPRVLWCCRGVGCAGRRTTQKYCSGTENVIRIHVMLPHG